MPVPLDFDPNNQPRYEWATYVPGRSPQFKLHEQRGHALNAFRTPSILYRFDPIQHLWVEVCRNERLLHDEPAECAGCGEEVRRTARMHWIDRHTDAPRYVRLCNDCSRTYR